MEPIYPVIYLDAITVKIKDGGHVVNKAAHLAVGVGMHGVKHILGIWVQTPEGAKFWAGVCADLANRGVQDVLIVCCDGLTGFPEATAAAVKPIYTASSEDDALAALDAFRAGPWGSKYPSAVRSFQAAWDRFTPFLAFPPALRRVIYTTNAVESLNYQLPKVTKNPPMVTSPTTRPRSHCCGWRSATSRTNEPATVRRNAACPPPTDGRPHA